MFRMDLRERRKKNRRRPDLFPGSPYPRQTLICLQSKRRGINMMMMMIAVQCSNTQCALQCGTVQYALQCSTIQCALLCSTLQCAVQCSAVHCNAVHCTALSCSVEFNVSMTNEESQRCCIPPSVVESLYTCGHTLAGKLHTARMDTNTQRRSSQSAPEYSLLLKKPPTVNNKNSDPP